ncbi:MAG: class A beta-lactamase-related serine hydrolase [Firmicutes bacterium]|nr:class A beta-lactamase-related serine hydrolase [Bacillota bacterium]
MKGLKISSAAFYAIVAILLIIIAAEAVYLVSFLRDDADEDTESADVADTNAADEISTEELTTESTSTAEVTETEEASSANDAVSDEEETTAEEVTEAAVIDMDALYNEAYTTIAALMRNVGIYACDLSTGETFEYNDYTGYSCASSIKAAYIYYVCRLVDEGEATLNDILTYESSDTVYGEGVIGKSEVGTKYTLAEVIHYTVNISDNEGYNMLVRTYGRDGYDTFVTALGCDSLCISSSKYPNITAHDLGVIWQEIYNYSTETKTGEWLYEEFLSVSYMTFIEDATGYETANKDGWNAEACNAAGIVYSEDCTYVLVLLSTGSYYTINMESYNAIITVIDEIMSALAAQAR